jgi:hypothetical protein
MAAAGVELERRLVEYLLKNGGDLGFTKSFWRECKPLPSDIIQFQRFAEAQSMLRRGIKQMYIATELGVSGPSISNWSRLEKMPKLCHYLKALLEVGNPRAGNVWLTLEQTHGHAIPIGRFIQVPDSIRSWEDVAAVLRQFGLTEGTSMTREYLFGFLVGIIIGDAHKPKQGRGHRHIELILSKKYDTNVKIGDFTTFCAKQFGLRMERFGDLPKPEDKPHGFFRWASQSSPFIDWIFNVVIGLMDGEHTTYDQVHMDWAFESPRDFRVGLIQGIAESDGAVSIASQTVEFWVIPDWDFMIKLLSSFGLHGFRNREAVSLVKTQAINSFHVPVFSEHLKTVRYQRLELIAKTRKLDKEERLPDSTRSEIARLASEGYSVPEIVEEIARVQGLLISFEAAQRWARKTLSASSAAKREPASGQS